MFKKMLQAFGVGGPAVDTVLDGAPCRPGGVATGQVRLSGGSAAVDVQSVVLTVVAEVESEEADRNFTAELLRETASGPFRLAEGETREIPFQLHLPWETPLTAVGGAPLHGMRLGVRTEVAIAKAVDKGDLDPLLVEPLESQQRVLDAVLALGCQFTGADVEHGQIYGVPQQYPFYQEIEFLPPPQFAGRVNEIELTFVARPDSLDVVLEADKRGGLLRPGHDAFGRFHRTHEDALNTDWAAEITGWLEAVAEHGGAPGFLPHGGHDGGSALGGAGAALGGAVAGAAAGVVGGMVLGEVVDEIGDFFEGEEGEEED
ncbi:sporulation protein [Saccharopolyspora rectivirgula]|jgi:sporulation-control protein|uniref:Sporulation protein n=1 Tax=Saccharopolyspora rectivirgula TaxID=28042 RepID=A0A073AYI6_9PSEU|nr:sporulation protein [Saccharopolyspora rectivirgula]KEI44465.1 hypothetical protein GU90_09835 [Saccharopolyspora rectivirgula]